VRVESGDGVAPRNRAEMLTRDLLNRIRTGSLSPGDRLPPERTLAANFGVSRSVLRESLRSLVAMNVVQVRPGSGAYVTALDMASLLEPLQLAMTLEPGTLRSLLQARLLVEPPIAALAAQTASAQDVDRLSDLLGESRRAVESPAAFLKIDMEFHNATARMTRNPILMSVAEAIGRLARHQREFTNPDPDMRRAAAADHEEIFATIAAHDSRGAQVAMYQHLEHVGAWLLAHQRLSQQTQDDYSGRDRPAPARYTG